MNVSIKKRLEKKEAKLAEKEALLQAHRSETRELQKQEEDRLACARGRRQQRAGLLAFDDDEFEGFVLVGVAALGDKRKRAEWARAAREARAREEAEKAKVREELVIVFPGRSGRPDDLSESIRTSLREAGFVYNKFVRLWQGEKASWAEAQELAAAAGGVVKRVNEPEAGEAPPMAAE
jgi:hypothetical protein